MLSYSVNLSRSLTIVGMASPPSPVSPDVVRKVAALARLSVPEPELPIWTEQLGRIVSYIDQLKQLPQAGLDESIRPAATPLREDEPAAGEGLRALRENAHLLHDHGSIPRVVGATATEAGHHSDASPPWPPAAK
jgi:aspartyl/glutamyl-tRNA(Asn/Gln) amidotransferase C subunit